MKNAIMLGAVSATIVLASCSKQPSSSSATASSPDTQPVARSDGSNTWFMGAIIINGTNVSGTNVTIGVRTREPSK